MMKKRQLKFRNSSIRNILVCSFILYMPMSFTAPLSANINLPTNTLQTAKTDVNIDKPKVNPLSKVIPAYKATYTVFHKSDAVGKAVRELEYLDNEKVVYRYNTSVKWFIFSQKREEFSYINTKNLTALRPLSYQYTRSGTGKDKKYHWRFDAEKSKGYDLGRDRVIPLDFTGALQDKLSYHLQHRVNLIADATKASYSYPVVNTSGHMSDHIYVFDGKEELILPYGTFKTIRLKREIKAKERITYAWFAPDLNYLMVKLYQTKEGSEQFEAQLSDVTLNN